MMPRAERPSITEHARRCQRTGRPGPSCCSSSESRSRPPARFRPQLSRRADSRRSRHSRRPIAGSCTTSTAAGSPTSPPWRRRPTVPRRTPPIGNSSGWRSRGTSAARRKRRRPDAWRQPPRAGTSAPWPRWSRPWPRRQGRARPGPRRLEGPPPAIRPRAGRRPDADLTLAVGEALLQRLIREGRYDVACKLCGLACEEAAPASIRDHFEDRSARLARLGKPAPAIVARDVDGKPVSLAELKGRVVLVEFWATWCPPCVEAIPALQRAGRGSITTGASSSWASTSTRCTRTSRRRRGPADRPAVPGPASRHLDQHPQRPRAPPTSRRPTASRRSRPTSWSVGTARRRGGAVRRGPRSGASPPRRGASRIARRPRDEQATTFGLDRGPGLGLLLAGLRGPRAVRRDSFGRLRHPAGQVGTGIPSAGYGFRVARSVYGYQGAMDSIGRTCPRPRRPSLSSRSTAPSRRCRDGTARRGGPPPPRRCSRRADVDRRRQDPLAQHDPRRPGVDRIAEGGRGRLSAVVNESKSTGHASIRPVIDAKKKLSDYERKILPGIKGRNVTDGDELERFFVNLDRVPRRDEFRLLVRRGSAGVSRKRPEAAGRP